MNIEILLCIDCTGSMEDTINSVKRNADKFIDNIKLKFPREKYRIDQYKVRIVQFRDIHADGKTSIVGSKFYDLEKKSKEFNDYLNKLEGSGGSNLDREEDGLEGLAFGLKTTNWNFDPQDIQIIALWTDISSHKLEDNQKRNLPYYPKNMPRNLKEFSSYWNTIFLRKAPNASIVIFAPNDYPWKQIGKVWGNSYHITSVLGQPTGVLQGIFSDFASNYLDYEDNITSRREKIMSFLRLPFVNMIGKTRSGLRREWSKLKFPVTLLAIGFTFIKVFSFALFSITVNPTFNFYFNWSEQYKIEVNEIIDEFKDEGALGSKTKINFYTDLEKNFGWFCSSYDLILVYELDYEIPNYSLGEYSMQEIRETKIGASIITDHLNELHDLFNFDDLITVNVIGETDAAPIKSSIVYYGKFGDLSGKEFSLNDEVKLFDMYKGDTISNNGQLGFLRGYGLWNHMKVYSDIFIEGNTKLKFQVKTNKGYGNKYRKSVIKIKFYDVNRKE
jgi:hypothetical protein